MAVLLIVGYLIMWFITAVLVAGWGSKQIYDSGRVEGVDVMLGFAVGLMWPAILPLLLVSVPIRWAGNKARSWFG